ncbi:hypothetical protein DPEC_G00360970 [Dallia pectoralis]|uniref:Uncharacterized protein n=1 Tax=Dallia pectoralis TaxID=75939 RepID=A0ACC2F132_DALPE|nr:hypothetical protein DPEC_G00376270 [Dallia pectoralis]KAJ7985037.1 hypothetical protein DPEC_G00360970 [Dallia pectoralis]
MQHFFHLWFSSRFQQAFCSLICASGQMASLVLLPGGLLVDPGSRWLSTGDLPYWWSLRTPPTPGFIPTFHVSCIKSGFLCPLVPVPKSALLPHLIAGLQNS